MPNSRQTYVLALSGSQRKSSWCTALLQAIKALAPADIHVNVYEEHKILPLFNPDFESNPPLAVHTFRHEVTRADAVLIASPEYAHGVTGTIKNALDWLVSEPGFYNKPVALLNPSHQSRHADSALRETLITMSADLIAAASVRIPVIGSGIDRNEIAKTALYQRAIHQVLRDLGNHVPERITRPFEAN